MYLISGIFTLTLVLLPASGHFTISSPRVTNWGDWGPLESCPPSHFVNAIMIKFQKYRGYYDDTALNGVMLHCTELLYNETSTLTTPIFIDPFEDTPIITQLIKLTLPGNPAETVVRTNATTTTKYITSTTAPWGNWRYWDTCAGGGIAIGFRFRAEPYQEVEGEDDTAANDMALICLNGKGGESVAKGQGGNWGNWSEKVYCPVGSAICGIKTQVEEAQGWRGDNTALNNVDLQCCALPDPGELCEPRDAWVEVWKSGESRGENSNVKVPLGIGVQRKISESEADTVIEAVMSGSEAFYGKLRENFETSEGTGFKWENFGGNAKLWKARGEISRNILLKAGCETRVEQVVGECGAFEVKTNEIKTSFKCP